jgi:hypothetical protein
MSSGATSFSEKPLDAAIGPADNRRHSESQLEANSPTDTPAEADPNASPREIHGIVVRTRTQAAAYRRPLLLTRTHVQWALVVVAILSSIFLYSLDNTVVADITPAVVNDFGDGLKLPWLSVGYIFPPCFARPP